MTRSPARVLLVEDEAPARILLARGLERRGYRVTTVTDGSEALPMLHDGWDILVTDLCMPRLDGIGLLRMVRDSGVRAKCIVITSFADKERAIQALNLGTDYLLEKPFGAGQLADVMDRLLASGSGRGGNALEQRLEGLPLTQRERSLVMSVLHGQSNRQIATVLDQNEQSVKNALTAIYSKLGVKGRSELFHALFPL